MDREMRIDVRREAPGGPVGEHALLACRRRQTGDDCPKEPGVPVCRPGVERDDAVRYGVLDGGLESLERDPVNDLIADLVEPTVGQQVTHERKAVGFPGQNLDRVVTPSGPGSLGGLPDPGVGSVDEAVGETGAGEIAVEQDEGELDETVVVVLDGGHPRDPVAECRREGMQRHGVGVGMGRADRQQVPEGLVGPGRVGSVGADHLDDVVEVAEAGDGSAGVSTPDELVGGVEISVGLHSGLLATLVVSQRASRSAVPALLPQLVPVALPIRRRDSRLAVRRAGGQG